MKKRQNGNKNETHHEFEEEYNDSLIYIRPEQDPNCATEPTKITFSFSPGPDIFHFKLICMRLAHALGYQTDSIVSAFGQEESIEDPTIQLFKESIKNGVDFDKIFKK